MGRLKTLVLSNLTILQPISSLHQA